MLKRLKRLKGRIALFQPNYSGWGFQFGPYYCYVYRMKRWPFLRWSGMKKEEPDGDTAD